MLINKHKTSLDNLMNNSTSTVVSSTVGGKEKKRNKIVLIFPKQGLKGTKKNLFIALVWCLFIFFSLSHGLCFPFAETLSAGSIIRSLTQGPDRKWSSTDTITGINPVSVLKGSARCQRPPDLSSALHLV